MKMKLSPYLAAASCALLAACSTASQPSAPPSATPAPSAACSAHLATLYRQMGGNLGAARFQAAVNAESYAGTLGPACAGVTAAGLARLAAQAAGGH